MKKFLFLGALAALLLGTASCANDMEPNMVDDGTVTFKIELPGAIESRAISDGTTATKLEVACYDANGTKLAVEPTVKTDFVNREATVTYKLVKGQTYNFSFFAHAAVAEGETAPYTFDAGATLADCKFTVDYAGACNDENRDAFYAVLTNYEVVATTTDVILRRPFAQLNFGADDVAAAATAGIIPSQSKVTVKQAATEFNLSTGMAGGTPVDVEYSLANLPSDPETLTVEGTDYRWMEMCYFLVPANEANVDVEMTVKTNKADVVVPVSNVPVKKNHRTNIVGSLFTQDANFRVIIDQNFEQPDYIVDALGRPFVEDGKIQLGINGEEYNTLADAIAANTDGETIYLGKGTYNEAITVGADETVKISSAGGLTAADVIIPQQVKTEAGATLELTNVKITSNVHGGASVEAIGANTHVVLNGVETSGRRGVNASGGAEVVIKNSKINADIDDNEGAYYNRGVNIYGNGTKVTVEDSEVRCDTHYAFNYPGSASGTELTVKNCNVIGYGCVNVWGSNNNLSFENCNFTSINVNSGSSNAFAAFMIATDAAVNNTFSFADCSMYVEAKGDQPQWLIYLDGTGNVFNGSNTKVKGVHTLWNDPIVAETQAAIDGNSYDNFLEGITEYEWSAE